MHSPEIGQSGRDRWRTLAAYSAIFLLLAACSALIAFTAAAIYVASFPLAAPFASPEHDGAFDGRETLLKVGGFLATGGLAAGAISPFTDWKLRCKGEALTRRSPLAAAATGPAIVLPVGVILTLGLGWYGLLLSVSLAIAGAVTFYAALAVARRRPPPVSIPQRESRPPGVDKSHRTDIRSAQIRTHPGLPA